MNANTAKVLFGINALLHLLSILFSVEQLIFITKPLLMVLLATYFHYAAQRDFFTFWVMMGLVFSFGGDVALMFQEKAAIWFILGLGSFLVAHVCYIVAFVRYPHFTNGMLRKAWWWGILLLAYGLWLGQFLWGSLGEMRLPVMLYSAVIMGMGLSALHLQGRGTAQASRMILVGALLFILSDSVIALDKFMAAQLNIPYSRLVIMTTYILGQFLIVEGSIKAAKMLDK